MPNPASLVHQTATSTGTGNFTLVKVNGKQDFATAFTTGGANVFDYFISNQSAAEWERGTGSCPTTNTLKRDTVYETNAGTTVAIDFTAGTKDVTNDVPPLSQVRGTTLASSGQAAIFDTTAGNLIKSAGFAPQASLTAGTGIAFSGSTINGPTAGTGLSYSGTTLNGPVAGTGISYSGTTINGPVAGTGLSYSGTTLNIGLTSGAGITVSGATISAATATTTVSGISKLSDAARLRANTTGYVVDVDSVWGAAASVALSTGTTAVTVDMTTFLTLATLEMSTNHTLSNPTSTKVGQHFIIRAMTTGSTALTLTLGTAYKRWTGVEAGPYTIVASGAEKLYVAGFVETSTGIIVTAVGRTTAIT